METELANEKSRKDSTLPTATFYIFYILGKMSSRKLAPQFLLVMNVYSPPLPIPHVSIEERGYQLYKMTQSLLSFPFTSPYEVMYMIFVLGKRIKLIQLITFLLKFIGGVGPPLCYAFHSLPQLERAGAV